jgi:hypothetical protein
LVTVRAFRVTTLHGIRLLPGIESSLAKPTALSSRESLVRLALGVLNYACAARFAALAALAFARFANSVALRAGDIFLFAGALFAAGFAALTASHRFFVAAMMAFLPAAESFRLGLGAASGTCGSAAFLEAAHLLR